MSHARPPRAPAAVAVTLALAATLAACSPEGTRAGEESPLSLPPSPSPPAVDVDVPAGADDDTARFVACLVARDVAANVDERGFVVVRDVSLDGGARPADAVAHARFADDLVHASVDAPGRGWVAPLRAAFFTDPHTAQAWESCHAEHPGFSPLTWDDVAARDPILSGDAAVAQQAAVDFARRARNDGFGWVVDPGADGVVELPAWLREAELRDLLAAALDPGGPVVTFDAASEPAFDWRAVVGEFAGGGLG
ncbi:hypothetical protein [Xylanimonas ulmi]|uniref:Uncharacterized protein n=1 Tax=Xylanimonas ulmi TaxID=228973 RepID=A0A4Q7LZH1_9MICO|nr:hypothetical protein [Xylanibacterium ulmi]RZS60374.1 hypothetical protein EV386_0629 [Xylanibacterium ulmi]